jgi:hypothetical protein
MSNPTSRNRREHDAARLEIESVCACTIRLGQNGGNCCVFFFGLHVDLTCVLRLAENCCFGCVAFNDGKRSVHSMHKE